MYTGHDGHHVPCEGSTVSQERSYIQSGCRQLFRKREALRLPWTNGSASSRPQDLNPITVSCATTDPNF